MLMNKPTIATVIIMLLIAGLFKLYNVDGYIAIISLIILTLCVWIVSNIVFAEGEEELIDGN